MDDFAKLIKGCFSNSTRIARDDVGRLKVSTVYAPDKEKYETAIIDQVGTYIVEEYESEEEAVAGHGKWTQAAHTLTEVTGLGYLSLVKPEVKVLVPFDE